MAVFLHAAGFHCLTFDVRGHGANPPETLPLSAGEFGADALAAFEALLARPEVTVGGDRRATRWAPSGRSWPRPPTRACRGRRDLAPADPYRLTRQTFRLAHLPIPDPIAYPLAWLTTRVYLRPRGHVVRDDQRDGGDRPLPRAGPAGPWRGGQSSCRRPHGPAGGGREGRSGGAAGETGEAAPVETLIVEGGQHSWLYEFAGYRRAVAGSWPRALGGPLDPGGRGRASRPHTPAERIPDARGSLRARSTRHAGGLRTLAQVALPGATRPPASATRAPTAAAGRRAGERMSDPEPVWDAIAAQARDPVVRRPAARAGPPRADPRRRPARRQLARTSQRWAFIVCRERAHLRELSQVGPYAGHLAGAAVGDRPRHARPDERPTRRCRSCSTSGRRPRT